MVWDAGDHESDGAGWFPFGLLDLISGCCWYIVSVSWSFSGIMQTDLPCTRLINASSRLDIVTPGILGVSVDMIVMYG